jgi:hypothetical protein
LGAVVKLTASPPTHLKIAGRAKLMRIYIGESDRWRDKPLHQALVEAMRANDIAGVAVYRGLVTWSFQSLDPNTGQPTQVWNPFADLRAECFRQDSCRQLRHRALGLPFRCSVTMLSGVIRWPLGQTL